MSSQLSEFTPIVVSLTEQVYGIIKTSILNLELKQGDALVEATLAKKLGTSKTPIREALKMLEKERLVVIVPYKGAVVASLDPQDIKAIFQTRAALEGMLARLASRDLTDEQIKEMRSIQKKSEEALAAGNLSLAASEGTRVHQYMIQTMNHKYISPILVNLADHLERFFKAVEQIPGRVAQSIVEHGKLVELIAQRNPDAAQLAVISHMESFLADFWKAYTEQSGFHPQDRGNPQ